MRRARRETLGAVLAASCAVGATACSVPPPGAVPFDAVPVPAPEEVAAVLFLIGDAGDAEASHSPLLSILGQEVEEWSAALAADSAVTVLFLGDNVYPEGLRDRSHPNFASDSTHLWSQVAVVSGPAARAHRTAGWFLAGNHDWGERIGAPGVARLRNQQEALSAARAGGLNTRLLPDAGNPGPVVRDVGDDLRLLLVDTHWFLTQPPESELSAAYDGIEQALSAAGRRDVIVAAHHPLMTSGPHGYSDHGLALGYYWLLGKTGTLVQNLNSPLYSAFIEGFRGSMLGARKRPLIFAAGHDHTLQVLEGRDADDPLFQLVSGAGSKVEPVAASDNLRFASRGPGYMKLFVLRNGAVLLFVTAGDTDTLWCDGQGTDLDACMARSVSRLTTAFSMSLREAR